MAKLSAGKRTELVRLRKDETNCRITVALMSDGKILRKMQTNYPYPGMQASPAFCSHSTECILCGASGSFDGGEFNGAIFAGKCGSK